MDVQDRLEKRFDQAAQKAAQPPPRTITFDPAEYAEEVAKFGLNEDQSRELLETLWNIMVMFVDLGFRVDPVSLACGQVGKNQGNGAVQPSDLVELRKKIQSDIREGTSE